MLEGLSILPLSLFPWNGTTRFPMDYCILQITKTAQLSEIQGHSRAAKPFFIIFLYRFPILFSYSGFSYAPEE